MSGNEYIVLARWCGAIVCVIVFFLLTALGVRWVFRGRAPRLVKADPFLLGILFAIAALALVPVGVYSKRMVGIGLLLNPFTLELLDTTVDHIKYSRKLSESNP